MGIRKTEIQAQIKELEIRIVGKQQEAESLEMQLANAYAHLSQYTHKPQNIVDEINGLESKSRQAQADIQKMRAQKDRLQDQLDQGGGDDIYRPAPANRGAINVPAITLGPLLVALIVSIVFIDIKYVFPMSRVPVVHNQMLDPNYHHLGDNDYSAEYVDSITGDKIHNLATEGLTYVTSFDMLSIREAARVSENTPIKKIELVLFVNALKPRESAPVIVGLSGQFVAYLNDFVTTEEFRRKEIRILLDVPVRSGQNEIQIITGKDVEQSTTGFDEYEDFEFDHLALEVTFDADRPNMLLLASVIAAELLVLGAMLYLLVATQRK